MLRRVHHSPVSPSDAGIPGTTADRICIPDTGHLSVPVVLDQRRCRCERTVGRLLGSRYIGNDLVADRRICSVGNALPNPIGPLA